MSIIIHFLAWTFTWNEDENPGGLGFTIYDEKQIELFKRDIATAGEATGDTIVVPGIINRVVFNSNSDGFHGQFQVGDPDGNQRQLQCTGCESTSKSLMLGSLYLDGDQQASWWDTSRPNNANCRDNCVFNIKVWSLKWNEDTNPGRGEPAVRW